MDSLLYDYMDKFLFLFATEDFITRDVKIVEFDRHNFKIKAEAYVVHWCCVVCRLTAVLWVGCVCEQIW